MSVLDRIENTIKEYKATGNRRLIDGPAFHDAVSGYGHSVIHRCYPEIPPDARQDLIGRVTYTVLSRTLKGEFFNVASVAAYIRVGVRNQARRYIGERYDEEDVLLLDMLSGEDVETVPSSRPFLSAMEIASFVQFVKSELRTLDRFLRENPFTRAPHRRRHFRLIVLYTAVYGTDSRSYGLGLRSASFVSLLAKRLASNLERRFKSIR